MLCVWTRRAAVGASWSFRRVQDEAPPVGEAQQPRRVFQTYSAPKAEQDSRLALSVSRATHIPRDARESWPAASVAGHLAWLF